MFFTLVHYILYISLLEVPLCHVFILVTACFHCHFISILCCQILTPNNTRPKDTPKLDDQNQLIETRVSHLQQIGAGVQLDPIIIEGNKTLVIDEHHAHQAQEERNAELRQAHDDRTDTRGMLERYLQQDKSDEPWKP